MSRSLRIARYQISDMMRSRWLVTYTGLLILAIELLFRFGNVEQVLLTLSAAMLLIVPLVSLMLGVTHFYNSADFMELLMAQPIGRLELFRGSYLGVATSLAGASLTGMGLPLVLHRLPQPRFYATWLLVTATAVILTFAFVGVAYLIANLARDKTKGLGTALLVWFTMALLYDALILVGVSTFADYPLEIPVLLAMFLNPLDLVRTLVMLQLDAAALMGYSGAVFARFLNSPPGIAAAAATLLAWAALPAVIAGRVFKNRDF